MLVDRHVEARAPMSEATGYDAKHALDEGLAELGRRIVMHERIPRLPELMVEPEPEPEPGTVTTMTGRKSNKSAALAPGWGLQGSRITE